MYRFSQLSVPEEWREELEEGYEAMRIIIPDILPDILADVLTDRQTKRQAN